MFPADDIKDICNTVIDEYGKSAFQYSSTEGEMKLRGEIVKLAAKDGVKITEDNVLVTVSSQQGLDLVGKVFIDPSDPVIVELPSYVGGLRYFRPMALICLAFHR